MKFKRCLWTGLGALLCLAACDSRTAGSAGPIPSAVAEDEPGYVVLDEDLSRLKDDFNSHADQVRLLFVVGDTCGICLRGMADLDEALLARAQGDDRLVTLVAHVPVLGAQEEHVPEAMGLMHGPRVHHYWDGVGTTGIQVRDALQLGDTYAWDVWLAYAPGARWEGDVLPPPTFWMHQLSGLDRALRLDAEAFAGKTLELMQALDPEPLREARAEVPGPLAKGAEISAVIQPVGVAIGSHIRSRGGYARLKRVQRLEMEGEFEAETGPSRFSVVQDRAQGLERRYAGVGYRLPALVEKPLDAAWEMDGLLVDWKDKGHQVRMAGMRKLGPALAWRLYLRQSSGRRWALFIDSHSGDLLRQDYLGHDGQHVFSILASDFRVVDGIRLPFERTYLGADGDLIATERYAEARVELAGN